MEDFQNLMTGLVSFCLLVFASWCVGEGGEILGKKYDASIIGGLVIAWLNTALSSGNPKFAVGAVSGSTIVVCTVALGACLWIGARARGSGRIFLQHSVKSQCYILAASTVIPASIIAFSFNWVSCTVGLVFYFLFLIYSLQGSKNEGKHSEDIEAGEQDSDDEEEESTTKGVLFLCLGGILIFVFSNPFINAVVATAFSWRISPTLLAFFLAPIASEAPEILESISLSRKGNSQSINIAFSNLVGGTITKTTLLCSVFCFYGLTKEYAWESPNYTISMTLLIISAATAASIGGFFQSQTANHGIVLFVLFAFTGLVQYFCNGSLADIPPEVTEAIEQTVAVS
ncbi:Sodium/calcium exchanger membrane region [Balamuthia mandrillaris]